MNKKIIAIALAGAFVPPLAMADVTIYGFVSAAIQSMSATGGTNSAYNVPNRGGVDDQNSRIGFKGTEDLGNGLTSIWQVENSLKNMAQGGVSDNGAGATFATRNTFVGLQDASYGTVRLGYYDSAYKRYTNMGPDFMPDTVADTEAGSQTKGTSYSIQSRGDARLKNSVHYDSPVLAGFQAGASYGFGENNTQTSGATSQWDLGGTYTQGGLKLGVGYNHLDNTAATATPTTSTTASSTSTMFYTSQANGEDTTFYKLAASYKFAFGTLLAASFEHASYGNTAGGNMTQNDWTVGAAQDIGNGNINLSYSKLDNLNNAGSNNWGANQWVLGATYNLSKKTELLAYATRISNEANQDVNFGIDPLYQANSSTIGVGGTQVSAGSVLKAIGVGMKYSF